MGCNLEHEISSLKVYDCLYNEFLQDGNQEIREKISKEGEGLLDSAKDYYALNKEKREEEIIVSLTTIPSRLEAVAYPIKCMLVQTMRPDRIILWIDKSINQESLPDTLCELQKYGLEIRYVEDVGPHTKYFYAIKEFADSIVITIDDDVFYRRNLIEDLYATHKKYPKCVCACWVWEMKFTYNGIPYPYRKFYLGSGDFESEPSHKLKALGVGGVLYPPNCFDERVFDIETMKKVSFKNDDIWLKAIEILNDVKVARVEGKNYYQPVVGGTQKIALMIENNAYANDIYFKNVFKYFDLMKYFRGELTYE